VEVSPGGAFDLVGRYAAAVLRFDADRFADLWTEDAEWVVAGGEALRGRAVIVETFVRARSGYRLCVQEIMSGYADRPEGAGVTAHWQVRELQWRPDGSASQLIGVYHDDLRAVDGAWRFARRRFELVYRGSVDLSGRLYLPPRD
jgi:hypothetical protein